MALSEIEKLERRYAENPQGLTFAPLAEVHRKNGEVQRALDLLGPGLELHPDYIPASIVLGRCHLDTGNVQAAEKAFLHVLELDSENVIALKALAVIGERLLRFEDAERWLNTLLAVDRTNDDAREQLQRVEAFRRQAEVGSSAEPASVAEPPGEPEAVEAAAPEVVAPGAPPPRFEPPLAEPAEGWVSHSLAEITEPSPIDPDAYGEPSALRDRLDDPAAVRFDEPADIEIQEPIRLEDTVEPLPGLVGREVDTPDQRASDFGLETSDDIVLRSAGGSEFQMPDDSQDLSGLPRDDRPSYAQRGPFEEDAPLGSAAAAESPPSEPKEERPFAETREASDPEVAYAARETSDPDWVEPDTVAPEPLAAEPLTPESLTPEPLTPEPLTAELVAPEPVQPEPVEPDPMEPEPIGPDLASPPAPAAAYEPVPTTAGAEVRLERHQADDQTWREEAPERREERATPAPPRPSYSVAETGGPSVVQLLQGILSARPPQQSAAAPVRQAAAGGAGAPTRPAADALSLSSVFGEEASSTPPAVPASNPGAGSVSFDDFFNSQGGSPASRTQRAPDPKNDDLDQFHAWLQNLKR